jgi:hypothetical protein
MVALVFPASPTEGQIYTPAAGISYVYHAPTWRMNPDGDKGDVVVSGGGGSLMFDSAVVTTAAKTVLDDASTTAMRATLGAIEEAPNDGYQYTRSNLGWVVPAPAGLSTAEYTYSTTLGGTPSTGQMRLNTGTQSAVTSVFLHDINAVGVDIANALRLIVEGDRILIQDKTNSANYHYYNATADAIEFASHFEIQVAHDSGGSNFTPGRVIFAVFGLGTGGGGTGGSGGGGTVTIINSGSFF